MYVNPEEEAKLQAREAKKKASEESANIREKKKLTREEILERKIIMARERGSRVLKINSPVGNTMFNVLRQFDQAYAIFKTRLGEPGGIPYEEGAKLMAEALEITLLFSDFTSRLSKKMKFQYFAPQELKEIRIPAKE